MSLANKGWDGLQRTSSLRSIARVLLWVLLCAAVATPVWVAAGVIPAVTVFGAAARIVAAIEKRSRN